MTAPGVKLVESHSHHLQVAIISLNWTGQHCQRFLTEWELAVTVVNIHEFYIIIRFDFSTAQQSAPHTMLSLPSISIYQNAIPVVFVKKIKLITVDRLARVSWTFRTSAEHFLTKNSFSDVIIKSKAARRLINYATVSSTILYFINTDLPSHLQTRPRPETQR